MVRRSGLSKNLVVIGKFLVPTGYNIVLEIRWFLLYEMAQKTNHHFMSLSRTWVNIKEYAGKE